MSGQVAAVVSAVTFLVAFGYGFVYPGLVPVVRKKREYNTKRLIVLIAAAVICFFSGYSAGFY